MKVEIANDTSVPPRSGVHRTARSVDASPVDIQVLYVRYERIMASLPANASKAERTEVIARLAELLQPSGIPADFRDLLLECIQSLARRKPEEEACCQGIEAMRRRFAALHGISWQSALRGMIDR